MRFRRPTSRRGLYVITLLASAIAFSHPATAQDANQRLSIVEQRLKLPELRDRLKSGSFVPVPADEYRSLKQSFESTALAPNTPIVQRAEYEAELVNQRLVGKLRLEITRSETAATLLTLAPSNLRLTSPLWQDERSGVIGTTVGGEPALVVESSGSFTSEWTHDSREADSTDLEFNLAFPKSVSSTLTLAVPENLELTSSNGITSNSVANDGKRTWTVQLGNDTRTRLRLRLRSTLRSVKPLVFFEQMTAVQIRADRTHTLCSVNLNVERRPLQKLIFRTLKRTTVVSASYGETPLRVVTRNSRQFRSVIVELPVALIGQSAELRLETETTTDFGQQRRIPVPQLSAVIPENSKESLPATLVDGRIEIQVARSIALTGVTSIGARQTQASIDDEVGQTTRLVQDAAHAVLRGTISSSAQPVEARSASLVTLDPRGWNATCIFDLSVDSGEVYQTPFRVLPGWEFKAVTVGSTQRPVMWSIARNEATEVKVDFPAALTPDSPRRVIVTVARLAAQRQIDVPMPPVVPVSASLTESLVSFVYRLDRAPTAIRSESVERLTSDTPDLAVLDDLTTVPSPSGFSTAEERMAVRLVEAAEPATFRIAPVRQRIEVSAITTVERSGAEADQSIVLECSPIGPSSSLFVYITTDDNLTWRTESSPITARRVGTARNQQWRLPNHGQLWRLQFAKPQTEPFILTARLQHSRTTEREIPIVFVPACRDFRGRVLGFEGLRFEGQKEGGSKQAFGTEAVPSEHVYQSATLRCFAPDLPAATGSQSAISSLTLESWLHSEANAAQEHSAIWRIDRSHASVPFRFRFPTPPLQREVFLNGRREQSPLTQNGEVVLPLQPDLPVNTVKILYRVATSGSEFYAASLPEVSHAPAGVDWLIHTPNEARVTEVFSRNETRTFRRPGLIERLFGPLARDQTDTASSSPARSNAWQTTHCWLADPAELKVTVSDRQTAELTFWFFLFTTFAVGLPLRRLRTRRHLLWLSALAFACTSAATLDWSVIPGAIAVGTLICALIPQREESSSEEISLGSTRIVPQHSATTFLVMVLLCHAETVAQIPTMPSESRTATDANVLLTADEAAIPLHYVETTLLEQMRIKKREAESPAYILTSAHYAIKADSDWSVVVRAKLKLSRLQREAFTVELPFATANPSECLIDGHPTSIRQTRRSSGIVVDLPDAEAKQHSIEIELHPATKSIQDSATGIEIQIPPCIETKLVSRVAVKRLTTITSSDKTIASEIPVDEYSAKLPLAQSVRIRWQESRNENASANTTDSIVFVRADIGRSLTRMRLREVFTATTPDQFYWDVPAEVSLQGLVLTGLTESNRVARSDGGTRLTLNRTDAAQTAESVQIEASFQIPSNLIDGEANLEVPELHGSDSSFNVNAFRLALTPADGYELRSDPEATRLSADEFPSDFRGLDTATLVEVYQPSDIPISLRPLQPRRRVRLSQTGRLHSKRVDWQMVASVTVARAPAFRHVIRAPRQFVLQESSVMSGGANRLIRAIRRGQYIELLLDSRTSGVQTVELSGFIPAGKRPFNLPLLQFENADISESDVILFRDHDITVNHSVSTTGDSSFVDTDAQRIFVGRYRADEIAGEPFTVRPEKPVKVDSARIIQRRDNSLLVENVLRCQEPVSEHRVIVPAELAAEMAILADNCHQQTIRRGDGSAVILLDCDPDALLLIESRLPKQFDSGKLPSVDWLGSSTGERYLQTPRDLQPLAEGPAPQEITVDAAPEWINRLRNADTQSTSRLFRGDVFGGLVEKPLEPTSGTSCALVDSLIRTTRKNNLSGTTTFYSVKGFSDDLPLRWPASLEIQAAFCEARRIDCSPVESGQLTIGARELRGAHSISICWADTEQSVIGPVDRRRFVLPAPLDGADYSLVTMEKSASAIGLTESTQPEPAVKAALERLRILAAIARQDPSKSSAIRRFLVPFAALTRDTSTTAADTAKVRVAELQQIKEELPDLGSLPEIAPPTFGEQNEAAAFRANNRTAIFFAAESLERIDILFVNRRFLAVILILAAVGTIVLLKTAASRFGGNEAFEIFGLSTAGITWISLLTPWSVGLAPLGLALWMLIQRVKTSLNVEQRTA